MISFSKKIGVILVLVWTVSFSYAGSPSVISADVSKLRVERLNGVMFRYIEFFDYPCFRLETLSLSKGDLSVNSQKDVCSLTPKGEGPITFEKNVTAVVPNEIKRKDTTFSFRAEYVLAEVGAPIFYTDCEVEVKETGELGRVRCGKRHQLELDSD